MFKTLLINESQKRLENQGEEEVEGEHEAGQRQRDWMLRKKNGIGRNYSSTDIYIS